MKLTSFFAIVLFAAPLAVSPLKAEEKASVAFEMKVPEMVCAGCAWSVTQGLKKLEYVSDVYVDAKTKTAIVAVAAEETPGEKAILAAVKTAGYEASGYTKLKVKFAEAKAALTGEKG